MFNKDWKKILDDEDDDSDLDEDLDVLDFDDIKKNMDKHTTKSLCDIIVCDRYISFNKDLRVLCMEELAKRRLNGDEFQYEEYIETTLNELPKINIDIPSITEFFNQFNSK